LEQGIMVIAFVGVACGLFGIALGWLSARKDLTGPGFATLGLVAGVMLGLSASPVVGTAVSALFGLFAILMPVYFQRVAPAPAPASAGEPPPAAASSIPSLNAWLFPFALGILVGIFVGIVLRVNDGLNFASANLKDRYTAMGFDADQVKTILASQVKAFAAAPPPVVLPKPDGTILHTLPARPTTWEVIWSATVVKDAKPEDNLARLKLAASPEVQKAIANLEAAGLSARAILFALQDRYGPGQP
jgi:hypothetical protein